MATLKCKMCGGNIIGKEGESFGTCQSCGSVSTIPPNIDDRTANLFNRANHFRQQNDFDKALAAYENILNENNEIAEAHWGALLSRFGIEYVQDPTTGNRVPTCHRLQYDSVLTDSDYLEAVKYAPDEYCRSIYQDEAQKISVIQKRILEISKREEPYDVFICYKEKSESGTRTKDSVIAQDIYYHLTNNGYRVFFSRLSLERMLGEEYEPCIFSALNSARVMLVIGTSRENFDAVWVKNEWSRYLALRKKDRTRYLFPCYKDVDPYDLPEELSELEGLDMSKIGFVQDLLHGIEKILKAKDKSKNEETVSETTTQPGVDSLMKRGNLFLEDHDWRQAQEYFNRVLDINPEHAPAYIGLLCVKLEVADLGDYLEGKILISGSGNSYTFYGADYIADVLNEDKSSSELRASLIDSEDQINKSKIIRLDFFPEYKKALRFADDKFREVIVGYDEKMEKEYLRIEEIAGGFREKTEAERKRRLQKIAEFEETKAKYSKWSSYIDAGQNHVLFLKNNGTVVAVGDQVKNKCNVEQWREIIVVRAATKHSVGLKANGTVVAVGDNEANQCNVDNMQDIIKVAAGKEITIGIRADGSIMATELDSIDAKRSNLLRNIRNWSEIAEVSIRENMIIGLKKDGTVLIEIFGRFAIGEVSIKKWNDIISVASSNIHTLGLRKDGTVIASGDDSRGQCAVTEWTNVFAIAAGGYHSVGLKSDGTVVAVGNNKNQQCETAAWHGVVAIAAGGNFTVGLMKNGKIVTAGVSEENAKIIAGLSGVGPGEDS